MHVIYVEKSVRDDKRIKLFHKESTILTRYWRSYMNIDTQWLINRIKILESRASQFESTLKETMKVRDELNEKLKIAREALEKIGAA